MRYTFLILFTFFTVGSAGWFFYYVSGNATLDPNDYDWLEGRLESIAQLNDPYYSYQDQRDSGIRLKLEKYNARFSIGGRDDIGRTFELVHQHSDISMDSSLVGKRVAVQILREEIRRLKNGETLLINPDVAGLKVEGKTIYTLADVNQNTDSSFWVVVILLAVLTFGGLIGTLNQVALIVEERRKGSDLR